MDARLIVQLFIPIAIGTIMLTMGLGLRPVDFHRVVVEPRAVALGLINQLVILPLVGVLIVEAFALPPPLAVGLILLTVCPGGPSSNLYSRLARGDVALSVSLTALSGVITIFTIPFLMELTLEHYYGAGRTVAMPVGETMLNILLVVGVPLALGMWLRARHPRVANRLEPTLEKLAVLLLAILVVGAILKERARIGDHLGALGLPIVLLSVSTIAFGIVSTLLARLSMRQAVTIGIETGMQNAALAMGLAIGGLGSEEIAMPAVVYGIVAYFTCALPIALGRFVIRRRPA